MNKKQSSIGDSFIESSLLLTQLDYLKSHHQDLTESFQRTAISRSYYGIYHLARAFANRGSDRVADIRATRNVCDYKDSVPYNLSSKVQQVQRACNQIRESIAGLNIWLDTIEQEYKK